MGSNRKLIFAWIFFVITLLMIVIRLAIQVIQLIGISSLHWVDQDLGFSAMVGLIFSMMGMLIITRLPDNRVGWLMMIIAVGAVNPVWVILASLPTIPTILTPRLWIILWLNYWIWIPVIFPILLIPFHFPTGRTPSRRWNWVNWLAMGLALFFILIAAFQTRLGPENGEWSLPNPTGFIPDDVVNPATTVIFLGLVTVALSSVLSLFVRYWRAQEIERQQIKWLLYAGALFAVIYSVTGLNSDSSLPLIGLLNVLGDLSLLAIPIAIAIAILRYRLYDIDILIRRTMQYSLLTGLLVMVYFGSVVLLQGLFSTFDGQTSPLVIVISTLMIAALFNPLRRYLQNLIDRRFYRHKYDAERVLSQFAATARDEVDQESLTAALVDVVHETIQPEQASLWLISRRER